MEKKFAIFFTPIVLKEVHVYSLTFHCLELLSDGPDAKLIMIFTRVTDKDILWTARNMPTV